MTETAKDPNDFAQTNAETANDHGSDTRHFDHDDDNSPGWKRFEQYVPDVVKRSIVSGIGAIVMGEDGQRAGLGDLKLPKEVVSHLVSQVEKSKRDLTLVLARELRSFMDDVDISGVLQKTLEGMTIDLHTQIRFLPADKNGGQKVQMSPVETKVSKQNKSGSSPKAKTRKTRSGTGAEKTAKGSTTKKAKPKADQNKNQK